MQINWELCNTLLKVITDLYCLKITHHTYPTPTFIQKKIEGNFELTAEEELLHYVATKNFDKAEARSMLQEWFPQESFLPIE